MTAKADKSLKDLFVHALKDIYYAEKRDRQGAAEGDRARPSTTELKKALTDHLEETKGHVERLEDVFGELELKPASVQCEAIEGILKEGDEIIGDFGASPAGDAGIIFACQAVEHYEINRYGTMLAWAKELKLKPVAKLLKATLDEEYKADDKLTKLAEAGENRDGIVQSAAKAA